MADDKNDEIKQEALPLADDLVAATPGSALWSLGIGELTGKNIEAAGREEVNELLAQGWLLLHVYTLKYREDNIWRERPMAILGKPRSER